MTFNLPIYQGVLARPSVSFFVVCGGGTKEEVDLEYNFLLGSLDWHSEMGTVFVLDTSPPDYSRRFRNLPKRSVWVKDPSFGFGRKSFRMNEAVRRANRLAGSSKCDIHVYLDCDEFFSSDSPTKLFPHALYCMLEVKTVDWSKEGAILPKEEWHRRLWPSWANVAFPINQAWVNSKSFSGNQHDHVVPYPLGGLGINRIEGAFHHHVHNAFGKMPKYEIIYQSGLNTSVEWPPLLAEWRNKGSLPMERFLK